MALFLTTAAGLLLGFAVLGYLADRRPGRDSKGEALTLLPGDIKYESPGGNVRVYFPITTSIVLSLVLSLLMRFLG